MKLTYIDVLDLLPSIFDDLWSEQLVAGYIHVYIQFVSLAMRHASLHPLCKQYAALEDVGVRCLWSHTAISSYAYHMRHPRKTLPIK